MDKVIAERRLFYSEKGSDLRHEFKIRIGMPYHAERWNGSLVVGGCFGCEVGFEGLDAKLGSVGRGFIASNSTSFKHRSLFEDVAKEI